MSSFIIYRFLLLSAFLISFSICSSGQDTLSLFQIRTELKAPLLIMLKNGNTQTGQVLKWDGQNMRLRVSLGPGTADMSISAEEIRSIKFPGSEHTATLYKWMRTPGRETDALNLFRAFYRQRGAYLDLLSDSDIDLFYNYALFALKQREPLRAVAMIEVFRPYIEDPVRLREMDDAILMGFFLGGMLDEAEAQARRLIEAAMPTGASVMPWRILAELHFSAERYEAAFWTALQPIAYSNSLPMAELNICYALAIAAADELRLKNDAERLTFEMYDRGYTWPQEVSTLVERVPIILTQSAEAMDFTEKENTTTSNEELLEPLETPAPIDLLESLPSRLNL